MDESTKYQFEQMKKQDQHDTLILRMFIVHVSILILPILISVFYPISQIDTSMWWGKALETYYHLSVFVLLPITLITLMMTNIQKPSYRFGSAGEILSLGLSFIIFFIIFQRSEEKVMVEIPNLALLAFPLSALIIGIYSARASKLIKKYRDVFNNDHKDYLFIDATKYLDVDNELRYIDRVIKRKHHQDTSDIPKEE